MSQNHSNLSRQICSTLITFAGIALFSIVPAVAQTPGGSPQPASPSSSPGSSPGSQPGMSPLDQASSNQDPTTSQMMDKAFVRKALQGGTAEVQLGQLALQKSSNSDVKQFAQRMVDDHTKLGDQMKQVAQQLSVKVPDGPSSKDKATIAKLQALNGDAFDQAYIKDMVKDHQQDQKEFKQEAQSANNPALKETAAQGEQVITQHLQMIEQIAQKNNVVASK